MKQISIKYAPELTHVKPEEAARYFKHNGVSEYIDMLNWPTQHSYKPLCRLKVARSDNSLFIHYSTIEQGIRAHYGADQEPVREDSSVQFYCKSFDKDSYFNFEFNCIGACFATERKDKNTIIRSLNATELASIKRFASLGNNTFEEKSGNYEWNLTVEIPFRILGAHNQTLPGKLSANFYKCGDEMQTPHYLSWNTIVSDQPDFHRPEFFGELYT